MLIFLEGLGLDDLSLSTSRIRSPLVDALLGCVFLSNTASQIHSLCFKAKLKLKRLVMNKNGYSIAANAQSVKKSWSGETLSLSVGGPAATASSSRIKSSSFWSRVVVSVVLILEPPCCSGITGRRLIMRLDASSLESSDHRSAMSGMKPDCVRVDCVPSTLLKFMLTSDRPRRVDGRACCCCQRLVWLKAAIIDEADENRSGVCAGSESPLSRQEWTSSCSDGDGRGK